MSGVPSKSHAEAHLVQLSVRPRVDRAGRGWERARLPPLAARLRRDATGRAACAGRAARTLLEEVDEQLGNAPDLVAVPAGVGSLAEAVVRHHRRPDTTHPSVLSVEPDSAACVLASLLADESVTVPTGSTVMAGLNCGTVSSSAWPVLRGGCDAAVAVSDAQARGAVADLGMLGLSSGPSGAATLAGVRVALADPARRVALGLPRDAVIVLLSTEANP